MPSHRPKTLLSSNKVQDTDLH